MIAASAFRVIGVAALGAFVAASAHAEGAGGLQPYQLVRSLQLVQDRIASGDHAALPMQRKLLELIDVRLRKGSDEDFKNPKNFRALLVYAMSGGNPKTIEIVAPRLEIDDAGKAIVTGVVNYLRGQPKGALIALASVDPMREPPELGAFLALVKGSVISLEDPKKALRLLDEARLLGTGTLVEEAALRRSVTLAATLGDTERFLLASTQYVERFLRSPYASQFADAFVSGVVMLHKVMDPNRLDEITAMMDAEQEKVIYLRIARRAAIEGLNDLSAFASARAEAGNDKVQGGDDPRALLYAGLASVTSANVEDVKAKLKKIDREALSESDRVLLDAVGTIADAVTSAPESPPAENIAEPAPASAQAAPADAASAAIEEASPTDETVPQDGGDPESAEPAVLNDDPQHAAPGAPEAGPAAVEATMDPADLLVVETRKKLEAIDQMLGDTTQ